MLANRWTLGGILVLSLAATARPTRAEDSLAGRYTSPDGFTLVLTGGQYGRYVGTLSMGRVSSPVELVGEGGRFRGSLWVNGQAAPITLTRRGQVWRLTAGEYVLLFRKVEDSTPAGGGGEARDPEEDDVDGPTAPGPVNRGWRQYRHPMGCGFEYPPDWRLHAQQGLLSLVPPDLDPQREMMGYFGLPTQGIRSASAPGVGQYLDRWMRQLNPTARRADEPTSMRTRAGEGAVYAYTGRNMATGQAISARVYVIIATDEALAFSLVGDERTLARRGPTMDRIFASFSLGRPRLDRALLGAWYGEAVHRDSGTYASSRFTYFFREDGTIVSGGEGSVSAALRQGGGFRYRGDAVTGNVSCGQWCAADGHLIITWADGSFRDVCYVVRGQRLEFRNLAGKLLDYMER